MQRRMAIIWEEAGADPAKDRIEFGDGEVRTSLVAVSDPSEAIAVAKELVEGGAEGIELCGGFGPVWQARVMQAVGDRVPVGAITYGFESITAVADYKDRFGSGEQMSEAFIVLQEGTDPAVDRVVREDEYSKTTLVAVPDDSGAAAVAAELAGDGAQLIELYGGLGPEATARVIEAVGARVPVGIASYAPTVIPAGVES